MDLNAKSVIRILKTNFNYKVVKTKLGEGVEVDAFTGFKYANITGAGYLDDPKYPFTPKGLMKIFYNACEYKFVTGVFDNTYLKNTPYNFSLIKPFLFDSKKVILPVEFNNEHELQRKLIKLMKSVKNSKKYIIQRIELSKKGNGMEPFLEFLACETLSVNSLVENQIPLRHSSGSPDFGSYKINLDNFQFKNMSVIELAMIRVGSRFSKSKELNEKIIVGEAKTITSKTIVKQLDKYLKTKLFDEGLMISNKKQEEVDYLGKLLINKNYRIKIIKPKTNISTKLQRQLKYKDWLRNYIKFYLIANLTNDEFNKFYKKRLNSKISNKEDIVKFIKIISVKDILNEINKVIKNGTIK